MANLSCGIVGLPNVGKSTLFNALLKKQVAYAANYPFATIEPNVGVVEVPDERLEKLADSIASLQNDVRPPIMPAVVEFYDIAGLVRGAHKGEGLGNQFLSHIREVSVVIHVIRLFEDENIIRVDTAQKGPLDDMTIINEELIFADLSTLEKQREPKGNISKDDQFAWDTFQTVKNDLNKGIFIKNQRLTDEQLSTLKPLNLLTFKPQILVFNISENQLTNKIDTEGKIKKILNDSKIKEDYIYLCIKLENEILSLSQKEQIEYLSSFGLDETGLEKLIKTAYSTLDLISFLTAGEKEVRAWTIKQGTDAQNAAGVIHTDFFSKFIRADIVTFDDYISNNGWLKAKETGKVHSVGRDYVMKDGDVVDFKIAP
ncbi:MAG: redox-regulated ATPase YchF [Patescibacteria group bacterium]